MNQAQTVLNNVNATRMGAGNVARAGALDSKRLQEAAIIGRMTAEEKEIIATDKKIAGLEKAVQVVNKPFQWEFMGGIGVWLATRPMRWLGLTRAQTATESIIAPLKAMRATPVAGLARMPANTMLSIAGIAREAGGAAGAKWAPKADALADKLASGAVRLENKIAKAAAPLERGFTTNVDRFATTGVGARLHSWLNRRVERGLQKTQANHAKAMNTDIFNIKAEGMFTVLKRRMTGNGAQVVQTAETFAHADTFAHVKDVLSSAKNVTGQAHIDKLNHALETLGSTTGLEGAAAKHAQSIGKHIQATINNAQKMHLYESRIGSSLATIGKNALKSAGRMPIMNALMVVGSVLGLGLLFLNARKEKRTAAIVYRDMMSDLGDVNTPFAKAISNAFHQSKRDGALRLGVQAAGEAATFGMMALPGAAGAAMMIPNALPMAIPLLVKENSVLNAYEALSKELEPAQKLLAYRQLIAEHPMVARNGGIYNKVNVAMAEEMVKENLDRKAFIRIINNDAEFTARAVAIKEKLEKTPAPAAEVANAPSKAETAYLAAEKPAQPAVGKIHAGTVVDRQLAIA